MLNCVAIVAGSFSGDPTVLAAECVLVSPVFTSNTCWLTRYHFICEDDTCLPQDVEMFKYVMSKVKKGWNAFVYEQDWMDKLTGANRAVTNSTVHGRQWLMAMGDAAASLNMTIQCTTCMSDNHC